MIRFFFDRRMQTQHMSMFCVHMSMESFSFWMKGAAKKAERSKWSMENWNFAKEKAFTMWCDWRLQYCHIRKFILGTTALTYPREKKIIIIKHFCTLKLMNFFFWNVIELLIGTSFYSNYICDKWIPFCPFVIPTRANTNTLHTHTHTHRKTTVNC